MQCELQSELKLDLQTVGLILELWENKLEQQITMLQCLGST